MFCKLCKKEKELLKKSHILPNFLYKPLRGEDNEFYSVSFFKNKAKSKKVHTGFFEKHILCKECDNKIINEYETYFSGILDKLKNRKLIVEEKSNVNDIKYLEISPVDYTNTKLFFLSMLWRASISKLDEFSRIKLEPHQEEDLRNMILNKNPGSENYYPIFPMMTSGQSMLATKTFRESEIENKLCFSLVINGTPHFFFIENNYPEWALGVGPRINNKFAVILLNVEQGQTLHNSWLSETVNILKKEKNDNDRKESK
jgi:hypothetical protein